MKIVFTGIQGCGKGTQARILSEKYGFQLIEMGGEFRKVVASGSELGNKIKEIIDSGAQVNDELGRAVMKTAILENIQYDDIIYDGFIRNEWNIKVFNELVDDYIIVHFNLPVEIAKERLLGRMFDPETGETFPSTITVNPKTGNKLIKRDDDKDEKAILKRISEYEEKTLPIIEENKDSGKIIFVDANQSIDKVAKYLEKKLHLKK